MRLRANAYGPEPTTGVAVRSRTRLDRGCPPGTYLYVVDSSGALWVARPGQCPGHEALVLLEEEVYAAGWLRVSPTGYVRANASSGHFMAEDPVLPTEERVWRTALKETIRACGLRIGWIDPHMRPLDSPAERGP